MYQSGSVTRWQRFIYSLELDARVFVATLAVLCLFRIAFLIYMRDYIEETVTASDLWQAVYIGLRLSLKSAGVAAIVTFLFCTLPGVGRQRQFTALRVGIIAIITVILSLLFFARIPYYEVFLTGFNQMIFNLEQEDSRAVLEMVLTQYQLVARSAAALAVGGILSYLIYRLLSLPPAKILPVQWFLHIRNLFLRAICIAGLVLLAVFIRFGGSLSYAYSIHWENSAVTSDNLLNEAILDDVQALYRAYSQNRRAKRMMVMNVTPEILNYSGQLLAEKSLTANTVDQYIRHEAAGPLIPKPRHIFLIIAESYANWPLWDKYKSLNIANGIKDLSRREDSVYVSAFLPSGNGTIISTNSLITGLADVNMAANFQPESYRGPYETAFAQQLNQLGYETHFWYGGFASWQRLREFTPAQGFQRFHAANDFKEKTGNAWGVVDEILFRSLQQEVADNRPSFHMILTTSNHPPYTVDIAAAGFDPSSITGLPPEIKDDAGKINELGHFWYADKQIAAFITTMRQRYPDSLFIMTADHSDRLSLEKNPDLLTRYSVPLLIHGQGIHKNILPVPAAGSHIDILPTVLEMIAPRGFVYYSLGNSLTQGKNYGVNTTLWVTDSQIGKIDDNGEKLSAPAATGLADADRLSQISSARRILTWWRLVNGNAF